MVAPLNYFFQRQRPGDVNLKPDFGETTEHSSVSGTKFSHSNGPSLNDALRTWRFWAFAAGVLAGSIPLHMVLIHQVAAVSDAGFSKELAALGLGLIGLFTAPAMIVMGLLADRIGRQWSYALGSTALIIGIFLLMAITDASRSWLFYAFPPFIAVGFSSR